MFKIFSRLFKKQDDNYMDWDSYKDLVGKVDTFYWQQHVRKKGLHKY